METVSVIGAGPAGSAAALAALEAGAPVTIYEKSIFPRHKVCGEFLSPEAASLVGDLPASHKIRGIGLHIGRREKRWNLSGPAIGLSRYALDEFLLDRALAAGATLVREQALHSAPRTVIAHGRKSSAAPGQRLFGFKAHFTGPLDDALDLFFFSDCYVGICGVENGRTNVCGLAPENLLRERNFNVDELLSMSAPLWARTAPLTRCWDWLITGPLVYRSAWNQDSPPDAYLAGDALGFVDPFTGSGMLSAIATGRIAGRSAAIGIPSSIHLAACRKLLSPQYRTAAIIRSALANGAAEWLLPLLPGKALFHFTRPAVG
jgi:2-polyprenyl-6-methoxyphenol hydroxylase-like FAD-dependent oxidoreductase